MELLQTQIIFEHLDKKSQYGNKISMPCIDKDCHRILIGCNCSCPKTVINNTCNDSSPDPNIPVILWSLSAVILVLLILELVAIRFKCPFLDNFFGNLVFSMGIVVSTVTQFCTTHYVQQDNNNITVWYNVVFGILSIVFMGFGYNFLFRRELHDNIGSHDRGMGLVVAIISTFLVSLEIVLIAMVFKKKDTSVAFAIFLLGFASQKLVQVVLYIFVRRCKPCEGFQRGAIFYFYFLSFVNFSLWVNSIPFAKVQIYDEVSHTRFLRYVDKTCKALIVDYRLLCCLLFLEHALEISKRQSHDNTRRQADETDQMVANKRYFYTSVGVGIGLCFLVLEAFNGARYWHKITEVSLFPILVDASLVGFGYLLWRSVNISLFRRNKNVSVVVLMVTSMGAVSIIYLFCFGLLSLTSFKSDAVTLKLPVSLVNWSACVFLSRGASLLPLLHVYTGIPVSTMESSENHTAKIYVLVSALCSGLFARFIGCILDEFHGEMHEVAHHHLESNELRSLRDLFKLGPLFQLAATLHLALHFVLMIWRLHERPRIDVQGNRRVNAEPGRGENGVPPNQQEPNEHTALLSTT